MQILEEIDTDKLFAGTDHPVAHLYDINTFTCYLSANPQDSSSPINQVAFLFPFDSQALDCFGYILIKGSILLH